MNGIWWLYVRHQVDSLAQLLRIVADVTLDWGGEKNPSHSFAQNVNCALGLLGGFEGLGLKALCHTVRLYGVRMLFDCVDLPLRALI